MIDDGAANPRRGPKPMTGGEKVAIVAKNTGTESQPPRRDTAGAPAQGRPFGAFATGIPEAVCRIQLVNAGDVTTAEAAAEVAKAAGRSGLVGAAGSSAPPPSAARRWRALFPPTIPVTIVAAKADVSGAAVAYDTHQAATNPARCR